MAIKLEREHLQENKYQYVWRRDKGDSSYTGVKDRVRIDKDEGYEVLYFIQSFMNEYNLKATVKNVHIIENALHHPNLSAVVMRDELTQQIERMLNL